MLWPTELKRRVGKLSASRRYNQLPLLRSSPGGFEGSWPCSTYPFFGAKLRTIQETDKKIGKNFIGRWRHNVRVEPVGKCGKVQASSIPTGHRTHPKLNRHRDPAHPAPRPLPQNRPPRDGTDFPESRTGSPTCSGLVADPLHQVGDPSRRTADPFLPSGPSHGFSVVLQCYGTMHWLASVASQFGFLYDMTRATTLARRSTGKSGKRFPPCLLFKSRITKFPRLLCPCDRDKGGGELTTFLRGVAHSHSIVAGGFDEMS